MPVRGADKVVKNMERLVGRITGAMTEQTLHHVMSIGAAQAKIYTAVDTAALINSQRKIVRKTSTGMVGTVSYGQEYAIYLELKENWTPRKKITAKPHFLRDGFEDPAPRARIADAIRNGYKL